ncbi:nicotinate phosphoribosyltransferase [Tenacibaculum finnmarkense]|uniref:nicotinate phosphoribosyltransferase n=1 Tax=Tenacibaculum finnmarkense TaxID=2781243 RepID=UPI001EFA91AA|nr:nicotinate phosphoribosyltransferase [Tenacibaculum finnmarkense]MCG8762593.1 nicotinate phosphoribosyltransferase [Tenacibaculum finnmarkense]MCG8788085.1 nicotinate phosphoribosyltransferase [Tenacibaculum finnmarkense]
MNGLLLTDGYKTGHHQQYPKGTEEVYSNWTPRSNKYAPKGCEKVVSFGQQYVITWLHNYFEANFFSKPKDAICQGIKEELSLYLGIDYDVSHYEKLHDLQYLPIKVKSIKEGVEIPVRVPMLTVVNTVKEFYWVTNFLETILSTMLWQPMTSASIALRYKRIFKKWVTLTDTENIAFIDFQGHDFSMRGMGGLQSAVLSGMGHASVFLGSDTLPVISSLRKYYKATGFVIGSVNATEHSVMCAGTKDDEIGTFRELMKIYPTGILSVVSDTWDLWKVLTTYLPILKSEVLGREGKLVIRPDSGDPVAIICGENTALNGSTPQEKGVVELLWDIFGGTVNAQGFKVLDTHIGAIYGDSITTDSAEQICKQLHDKGFASTNVVLGIGSFTYQYNTRDTFGFAIKATSVVVNGARREIFKDPITDDGIKKSAKGLVKVDLVDGEYVLVDQVSVAEEKEGELKEIYQDGKFYNAVTLNEVRERINQNINSTVLV